MSDTQKGHELPCQRVIEWRINQSDCEQEEEQKLRTIREEGIIETEQAEPLTSACEASGIREQCKHTDDC